MGLRFHFCPKCGDVGTAPLRAHYTRYSFAIGFLDFRFERPLPVRAAVARPDKDMADCCLRSNKAAPIQYSCRATSDKSGSASPVTLFILAPLSYDHFLFLRETLEQNSCALRRAMRHVIICFYDKAWLRL